MALFRRKNTDSRPKVLVREADTRDLEAIVALLVELVADRVPRRGRAAYLEAVRAEQREKLLDPDAVWFVAARGEELVGCARVHLEKWHPMLAYLEQQRNGYLYGVFVKATERRAGAGRMLLARCETWLRAHGVRYAFLHSTPEAIPFYEAVGYEPCLEFAKK